MRNTLIETVSQALGELAQPMTEQVFASDRSDVQLMLSLIRGACKGLVKLHDWSELQTLYSFQTVPGVASYVLPADFERLIGETMWNHSENSPVFGAVSPRDWATIKGSGIDIGPTTRFRFQGGKLYLTPTPQSAQEISFEYISGYYAINPGDFVRKRTFTGDSDMYVFDDALVTALVKVKWQDSQEMDTTNTLAEYNALLDTVQSSDGAPGNLYPSSRFRMIDGCNIPGSGLGN